ncbi:DUF3347 domain-containing protein [Parasediminibacterium sp. JCM 36343]|uniref:DUF3347 domain-containing protein n=1 Tax=Parasediminibacterium sp. JCM 36343 TaxID=3374279 RepID=UPI00397DF82A
MKKLILSIAVIITTLIACNGNNKTPDVAKKEMGGDTAVQTIIATFPIKEILTNYLQLKNALAKDNSKDAATAANAMVAVLGKVEMKGLSKAEMKSYMDIADDLKENAEHIGANAGKIDHQREHFIMLSKDVTDLIKTFGNGGQTLYKDFCPMANEGKGALWISETKDIKNPYLGKAMPTCGSVKQTMQ